MLRQYTGDAADDAGSVLMKNKQCRIITAKGNIHSVNRLNLNIAAADGGSGHVNGSAVFVFKNNSCCIGMLHFFIRKFYPDISAPFFGQLRCDP